MLRAARRPDLSRSNGAQRFIVDGAQAVAPFTLATFVSTVCSELEVDVVRDWNVGALNYRGAVHYMIAAKASSSCRRVNCARSWSATSRGSLLPRLITKKNT